MKSWLLRWGFSAHLWKPRLVRVMTVKTRMMLSLGPCPASHRFAMKTEVPIPLDQSMTLPTQDRCFRHGERLFRQKAKPPWRTFVMAFLTSKIRITVPSHTVPSRHSLVSEAFTHRKGPFAVMTLLTGLKVSPNPLGRNVRPLGKTSKNPNRRQKDGERSHSL